MSSKTPLALMKEKFGDKAKLVEAIEKLTGEELWVARTNANKGLGHVSNAKLLRLHGIFTEVKGKFGTREKLVDAILELEKRTKDAGYRQRLLAWPVPRLYDTYKSTAKRVGASKPAAAKAVAPAKKAAKPAAEKAAKPAKKAAKKA
ncbi:MAG TPA: hypothetical protein VHS09_13100 [Polyangiaceae bacterium]|jgi:hypothetical protein|nr:hypothetical protein [Polyangiaceae bacterium]